MVMDERSPRCSQPMGWGEGGNTEPNTDECYGGGPMEVGKGCSVGSPHQRSGLDSQRGHMRAAWVHVLTLPPADP